MSCFNDKLENRKTVIEGGVKCEIDRDLASCPPGFSRMSVDRTTDDRIPYCFGDIPSIFGSKEIKIPRFVAKCVREKLDSEYSQNILGCCDGSVPQSNCKPGYCPGSNACDIASREWCIKKENFDGKFCRDWCSKNDCEQMKVDYCTEGDNKRLATAECRNYALETKTKKFSWDNAWTKYCNKPENKKNAECSCFDDDPRFAGRAACFSPTCQSSGYLTNQMSSVACSSLCQAIVSGTSGGNTTIDGVNIIQKCGSDYGVKKKDEEEIPVILTRTEENKKENPGFISKPSPKETSENKNNQEINTGYTSIPVDTKNIDPQNTTETPKTQNHSNNSKEKETNTSFMIPLIVGGGSSLLVTGVVILVVAYLILKKK